MSKPTKAKRLAYRARLIKFGVPEVYAHMAAENLDHNTGASGWVNAAMMIYCGFVWFETPEGIDFWQGIKENAEALGT